MMLRKALPMALVVSIDSDVDLKPIPEAVSSSIKLTVSTRRRPRRLSEGFLLGEANVKPRRGFRSPEEGGSSIQVMWRVY